MTSPHFVLQLFHNFEAPRKLYERPFIYGGAPGRLCRSFIGQMNQLRRGSALLDIYTRGYWHCLCQFTYPELLLRLSPRRNSVVMAWMLVTLIKQPRYVKGELWRNQRDVGAARTSDSRHWTLKIPTPAGWLRKKTKKKNRANRTSRTSLNFSGVLRLSCARKGSNIEYSSNGASRLYIFIRLLQGTLRIYSRFHETLIDISCKKQKRHTETQSSV